MKRLKVNRWDIIESLHRRVVFLVNQLPKFEQRLDDLNTRMAELSASKELYKDWNPTQLNNVYIGTLKYYNECVSLASKVVDTLFDEEKLRREDEAIFKRRMSQKRLDVLPEGEFKFDEVGDEEAVI